MPRTPAAPHAPRQSRDVQLLVALAGSLALSGCRLEDIYWENLLGAHINKLLQGRKNKAIETALEHLVEQNLNAYEILVEQSETLSESTQLTVDGVEYDALLFSAPIVAWTRYQLPEGRIGKTVQQALNEQLRAHIVAEGARLALIPQLVCFDQMPQSFQETWAWTRHLGLAALGAGSDASLIKTATDSEGMLADARFIVGAIVAPKGGALFRWQSPEAGHAATRDKCVANWSHDNAQTLASLFTGCNFEHLAPDAYYVSNREADRHLRPLALKASVTWLQTVAALPASDLRAAVVGCGDGLVEEYRIGFSTRHSNDVIYGCIWPILSKDEAVVESADGAQTDTPDDIAALIKELGVSDTRRLPGLYPAEFCNDCGAPYFPSPLGEMMHPELPEEIDVNPVHFH
ncbi:MAG: DUF2863 family protein [Candidimonas sp.]|nr:MAG: DUF2863 family protein [Candidimonas sp.]TAM23494.1 MAG: DUF2863 family protein [Candidimonas sp.]TAM73967.1 MAG: DUF2863 family protein [Candidimonas sp.]